MRFSISAIALGLSAMSTALRGSAARVDKRYTEKLNGVHYNVFEHGITGAKVSYVNNSGICETTAGVNQYSGYVSVGDNMNMFFW